MDHIPIPERWRYLFDGENVDSFLLTPLGRKQGGDLAPAACQDRYGGDADTAEAVLAVWRGDDLALVMLDPIQQVYGRELSASDLAAIDSFIARHRPALLDYWSGRTDSFELIDAIRSAA